jgi:hypothetical protein
MKRRTFLATRAAGLADVSVRLGLWPKMFQ